MIPNGSACYGLRRRVPRAEGPGGYVRRVLRPADVPGPQAARIRGEPRPGRIDSGWGWHAAAVALSDHFDELVGAGPGMTLHLCLDRTGVRAEDGLDQPLVDVKGPPLTRRRAQVGPGVTILAVGERN